MARLSLRRLALLVSLLAPLVFGVAPPGAPTAGAVAATMTGPAATNYSYDRAAPNAQGAPTNVPCASVWTDAPAPTNVAQGSANARFADFLAAKGGANIVQGANFTISGTRKINQITSRGSSERIIENTIGAPYTTRAATNKATGGSATVYYRESGAHVIVDDATSEVVQLSNRFNPRNWIPDDSIVDPYMPGR